MQKKCSNCSNWIETEEDFCECGGILVSLEEENVTTKINESEPPEAEITQEFIDDFFSAEDDENSEAIILDEEEEKNEIEEEVKIPFEENKQNSFYRLEFYKSKKKIFDYELLYDEITIGRMASKSYPDINLSSHISDNKISRNHAQILKEEEKYYLIRKSENYPVYLNSELLEKDKKYLMQKNDKVILTKEIGFIFA